MALGLRLVEGDLDGGERWVALYRKSDRLVGALTLNGQAVVMKYRRLISQRPSWDEGLSFAEKRRSAALANSAGRA
jgi:hypothetical protein